MLQILAISSLCGWGAALLLAKPTRKRYLLVAFVAVLLFLWAFQYREISIYDVFQIDFRATNQEIKAAYKFAMMRNHPDIVDAPDDNIEILTHLKDMADFLSDTAYRQKYDLFGGQFGFDALNNDGGSVSFVESLSLWRLIILSSQSVLPLLFIGYLCSTPKRLQKTRMYLWAFAFACIFLEVLTRYDYSLERFSRIWIFEELPLFIRIHILHRLFPCWMLLSMIYSQYSYVDLDEHPLFLMKAILATNRAILERIDEVIPAELIDR